MSEDFTAEMPLPNKPHRRPTLREERESERLSVGSFYAEQRKLVDARRDHLARLGMDPAHVAALKMPDLQDEPLPARGTLSPPVVPATARVAEVEETPTDAPAPKRTREGGHVQ